MSGSALARFLARLSSSVFRLDAGRAPVGELRLVDGTVLGNKIVVELVEPLARLGPALSILREVGAEHVAQRIADLADRGPCPQCLAHRVQQVVGASGRLADLLQASGHLAEVHEVPELKGKLVVSGHGLLMPIRHQNDQKWYFLLWQGSGSIWALDPWIVRIAACLRVIRG